MTRFTYTIDDDLVVSIFDNNHPTGNGAPNIRQDVNPMSLAGVPFASYEEAEAWALDVIDRHVNPEKYAIPVVDIEEEVVEEEVVND